MGRGPKIWNDATIERFRKEGRGMGEHAEYKPWLTVFDLSSLGRSRRVYGLKTGREHHLFSDVEWRLFLLLEWSANVVDIREQYPLDRDLTLELAASLGIRHPTYPGGNVPVVMTTDFFVTMILNGIRTYAAFDAKRSEDVEDARTLEKLEIQHAYIDGLGFPYHLVCHTTIPDQKVKNIEWCRDARLKDGEVEDVPGSFAEHANRLAAGLARTKRNQNLHEYCSAYDIRCGLAPGTGLRVARQLLYTRKLLTDFDQPNLPDTPLSAFRVAAPSHGLHVVGGR